MLSAEYVNKECDDKSLVVAFPRKPVIDEILKGSDGKAMVGFATIFPSAALWLPCIMR